MKLNCVIIYVDDAVKATKFYEKAYDMKNGTPRLRPKTHIDVHGKTPWRLTKYTHKATSRSRSGFLNIGEK